MLRLMKLKGREDYDEQRGFKIYYSPAVITIHGVA